MKFKKEQIKHDDIVKEIMDILTKRNSKLSLFEILGIIGVVKLNIFNAALNTINERREIENG